MSTMIVHSFVYEFNHPNFVEFNNSLTVDKIDYVIDCVTNLVFNSMVN